PLPLRPLRRFDSVPALAATVAAVIGCANLVWALSPGGSWLDDLLPRTGPLASTPIFDSLAFPAAMALIVCAFQLRRRNRAAWGLAVGLLTGLGLLKLLQGPNLAEAALALAVKVATILVLVSSSYLVFRSSVRPEAPSEGELRTARLLVRRHGADTLAFFKLRRDTQHLFSADRTAFLAYRIEAGVLIVS